MNKLILISGANKGVGFGTAAALARAGHTVLLGSRDEQRGADAAARLARDGLDVRPVRLDVTDLDTITELAKLVEHDYGRLDVLVNNAGISRDRPYSPADIPVDAVREVYETNVFGVVALTNTMLPLLRKSPDAYVANVSSALGTFAFLDDPDSPLWQYANLLAYNSSKAALNAITLVHANTLRAESIRVNAVSPGYVATDLNGHSGELTIEDSGALVARQILEPEGEGVFLNENGGTYDW